MPFHACALCDRPVSPKARNFELHLRDGREIHAHGTCLDDVVSRALDVRATNREKNRLENGP